MDEDDHELIAEVDSRDMLRATIGVDYMKEHKIVANGTFAEMVVAAARDAGISLPQPTTFGGSMSVVIPRDAVSSIFAALDRTFGEPADYVERAARAEAILEFARSACANNGGATILLSATDPILPEVVAKMDELDLLLPLPGPSDAAGQVRVPALIVKAVAEEHRFVSECVANSEAMRGSRRATLD